MKPRPHAKPADYLYLQSVMFARDEMNSKWFIHIIKITINHIINWNADNLTVILLKINALNEWKSNCRDLSTREKRIKTNSAVKINLTAYKNCHNYHLNAIVLRSVFYLHYRRNAIATLSKPTMYQANIIKYILDTIQRSLKLLKAIYRPVDTDIHTRP